MVNGSGHVCVNRPRVQMRLVEETHCTWDLHDRHVNGRMEDSHVIPGLIHKCYLVKKTVTPLRLLSLGLESL